MDKLGPKVIRRKVKRICFDFLICEFDLLINDRLYGVEPVSIVPNMKVLLVLQKQHFNQLFLSLYYLLVELEELFHQPLPIAPYCVGFGVRLNQFSCQLYFSPQSFGNHFR